MTVFSRVVMQRGRLRAVFLFGPMLFGQSQAPRLTRPSSLIASMRLTLGDDTFKDTKLYRTMPLEDLWKLHEEVISALASRVEAQKLELEKRLEQLGTRFGRLTNGSSEGPAVSKSLPKISKSRPRKLGLDAASNRNGFCCCWQKVDRWRTVASNNEPGTLQR
jgi:hypothetical protein